MNSLELREKLVKAQEKITKIEGTIEKHQLRADKKLTELQKQGYNNREEVLANRSNTDEWNDCYWLACDYENALQNKKDSVKKLKEQEQVVNRWNERLERQLEIERTFIKEVPDAFKQAREELKARWIESDKQSRDTMLDKKRELDYKEFRKLYTYTTEQNLHHTDEEFEKIEERETMLWVIDLYNRVYNITGKAVDCSKLYFNGKALNGVVVGENGVAEVETIGAGGYNIQRFHLRVLVHQR